MITAYVGIDNGVTGSIGVIRKDQGAVQIKTPTIKVMNYTKTVKRNVSRLNFPEFTAKLGLFLKGADRIICRIERPMINNIRFNQSLTAVRCFEAQLIALEQMEIPFDLIDSKKWQGFLFPPGTKGTPELKRASQTLGRQLFPTGNVDGHNDYDGLLIAEFLRRKDERI